MNLSWPPASNLGSFQHLRWLPLPLLREWRAVTILFDSDGHDNRKIRLAAFRLGRELARRGSDVKILFVPAEKGQ